MVVGKGMAVGVAQFMMAAAGTSGLLVAAEQEAEYLDWTQMQEQTLKPQRPAPTSQAPPPEGSKTSLHSMTSLGSGVQTQETVWNSPHSTHDSRYWN